MTALRIIRKARGLTTRFCAQHLGVVESTWVRWEAGTTDPNSEQRNAIADLLDASLDQLAGRAPFDLPIAS